MTMKKKSTILVPFDFSESSKIALDYTVSFVGLDTDIKIVLVHITTDKDEKTSYESFEQIKLEYAQNFRGELEWIIERGGLLETILLLQKRYAIDLIIMGTSGAVYGDSAITNSSALALETDDCPVLVIPKIERDFNIKKIALVLGKDKIEDTSVLEALLKMARRFNAKVDVLTIKNKEGIYGYSKPEEANENLLEYHLENFYAQHAFIADTDIVMGINSYTERNAIDMVAILPRNHAGYNGQSEGKLTKELAMNSQVPLFVID